jgi:O-acetylserine/cysteine efflux transporter
MIWLIILLCMIWGFNWVPMKVATDYFPPILFSTLRFSLGSIILLAILFYQRIPLPKWQDIKWYAICGLLQTTLIFACTQVALTHINIGVTSTLNFSMPFWLTIMAHFFISGEQINTRKLIGLIVGICGVFLVMDIDLLQLQWDATTLFYELLALIGAIGWAASNVVAKIKLQENNKVQFTAFQMFIGSFGLLIASFLFERDYSIVWSWQGGVSLLFAGVIASAFAFVLWFYILSKGEASKASVSLLLVPVFGVLSGWLVLGESISIKTFIGMSFVVTGIGIVNMQKKKQSIEHVYVENNREQSPRSS